MWWECFLVFMVLSQMEVLFRQTMATSTSQALFTQKYGTLTWTYLPDNLNVCQDSTAHEEKTEKYRLHLGKVKGEGKPAELEQVGNNFAS